MLLLQLFGRHEKKINYQYAIAFDPIEIQTCDAPQNDRLNHSFLKKLAKKWPEMVLKWSFLKYGLIFNASDVT